MELIYSMKRKPLKYEPPHFSSMDPEVIRPLCAISSCNIIAFSSPTELDDTECDTWSGHVYVCDLDTPWDVHKVTSCTYPISALEWDGEGNRLLVATSSGDVQVLGQKDYLLNEWTCLYSACFPGEHIVAAIFFSTGRRLQPPTAADKKGESPPERYQPRPPAPTLQGFGGVPCEGALVITASGLLGAMTPGDAVTAPSAPGGPVDALIAMEVLRPHRDHVIHASFAHKNGAVVVAATCASGGGAAVRCARCVVTSPPAPPRRRPVLALSLLPACLPHDMPTCLSWCGEDSDALLIGSATSLSLYKLTETHELLSVGMTSSSQKPTSDGFKTLVWSPSGQWAVPGGGCVRVTSLCASRVPQVSRGAARAVVAAPRHLQLLCKGDHHYVLSRPSAVAEAPGAPSPPKKAKYALGARHPQSPLVSCVRVSASCAVCVCVDARAQLRVYRLPQPWADSSPSPSSLALAASALELALVGGHDCLDLLLTIRPALADAVSERLTESFQRQPQSFQQFYYQGWLKLRIALARLVAANSSTVSWLCCTQILHATWAACKMALRPDDRADALSTLLDDQHPDHDKALSMIESKPESVPELSCLSPLRRVLQRGADIALSAVQGPLPAQYQPHSSYDLWSDPVAVSLLRSILCVSRGVGGVGDGDGGAGAAAARVLARVSGGQGGHRQDLIEECLSLSAACVSPRVWECLPRCSVSAPHGLPPPYYLSYGCPPDALRVSPPSPYHDVGQQPLMDSIRYMYLGGGARLGRWRGCGRCGARALPAPRPARHPLQRAHDARFCDTCRCGGKWTLFSNI